jgi:CYTH domain-containing protein
MQTEIERKFLVRSNAFENQAQKKYKITQGFLNKDKHRTVRIRIKDNKGFITVKGISTNDGLSRLEWEKEIEISEAKSLLELCEKPLLQKTRYEIIYDNKLFEVDKFHKGHEGLIIAEIELQSEKEEFKKPDWLGKEVTGNKSYYNSQL